MSRTPQLDQEIDKLYEIIRNNTGQYRKNQHARLTQLMRERDAQNKQSLITERTKSVAGKILSIFR